MWTREEEFIDWLDRLPFKALLIAFAVFSIIAAVFMYFFVTEAMTAIENLAGFHKIVDWWTKP